MNNRMGLCAALAMTGALVACSGAGSGTIDGGAGRGSSGGFCFGGSCGDAAGSTSSGGFDFEDAGSSSGGVSLSVTSTSEPGMVGGFPASSGTFYLVVDVTLENTGASAPLSTNPILFTLQTNQALDVTSSPAQASGECSDSVSVASGGQDACTVVFEVPAGQTPSIIVYDDLGARATAPVPVVAAPSAACLSFQGDFTGGSQTCLECLDDAEGVIDAGDAACKGAVDAYRGSCQTCATMCVTPSGIGALCSCELGCDDTQCQMLFQTLVSCLTTTCSAQCP
jgi:hypothetical protein